jgi:hypothetical protein
VNSYEAVIRSYKAGAAHRETEAAWWSDAGLSLRDTIRRASLSEIPSKGRLVRYSHQCRLSRSVLTEVADRLTSLEGEIARCSSFDELYTLISNVCSTVYGAGDLYAYDVAQRIGLRLGLHPDKVYLHTGVRVGARALGLNVSNRESIGVDELPPALRSLTPSEAEDVLCMYKCYFGKDDRDVPDVSGCSPRMKQLSRC